MIRADLEAEILIGVGLRHEHYGDVLSQPKVVDFVEVHAENFFAAGGASIALLEQVSELYPVSLHATTLGLGSAYGVPEQSIRNLHRLTERVSPMLVSDHACFAWTQSDNGSVHAGDLLPIAFNDETLEIMVENVQQVQIGIGQQLLIENLSAYLTPVGSTMAEVEFLTQLCQQAGSRLLLDLNNLVVNATNSGVDAVDYVSKYLSQIPEDIVGEIHLAGCSPALPNLPMIDDHSQPVSNIVWDTYRLALRRFGAVPTLIEWDTALPSWEVLTQEAVKARMIATEELNREFAY